MSVPRLPCCGGPATGPTSRSFFVRLEFDLPTAGVTHRPLFASGDCPPDETGAHSPLLLEGDLVGYWLRTGQARDHSSSTPPGDRHDRDQQQRLAQLAAWIGAGGFSAFCRCVGLAEDPVARFGRIGAALERRRSRAEDYVGE
jgi:hypothetical protein